MSAHGIARSLVRQLDSGEKDALGNVIVNGCPYPGWCRFAPGPTHRHSIMPIPPRSTVGWFAWEIEAQLRENDHKGEWNGMSASWLLTRCRQELGELARAVVRWEVGGIVNSEEAARRVIAEAADVAAFAMMIADVVQAETPGLLPSERPT
jgi:NTP pyrophosphatase (non-canonical NTP hydrolase)